MSYKKSNSRNFATDHQQDDWHTVHEQLQAVQKKTMSISDPDETDEIEADEIARKVVDGESAPVTGIGAGINRKGEEDVEATPGFQIQLQNKKGGGQPLDNSTRSEMESKMGADFSNVKVHTGNDASSMSERINAKAFTHGQDVFFNQGQYDPTSAQGKELLAHELVHTVQQGEGVARRIHRRILSKEGAPDKKYDEEDKVEGYYIIVPKDVKLKVTDEAKKWYTGVKEKMAKDLPNYDINTAMAFKDEDEAVAKAMEILEDMHGAMQTLWVRPANNPNGGRVKSHVDYDFKFDTLQQISNAVLFRLSVVQNMHFANTGIFARYPRSEDVKEGTPGFNVQTDKMEPTPIQTGKKQPPGDRAFINKENVTASESLDELTSKRSTRTAKEEKNEENYNADQRILIDCRTMISLVQSMSMRQVINDDAMFNKKFEKDPFILAPFTTPTKEHGAAPIEGYYSKVEIMTLDDLVVGDIVNFTNKPNYSNFVEFNSGLLWSSEWAQYKGKVKKDYLFEGFGAAKTYDQMNQALLTEYKKGYDSVKNIEGYKAKYGTMQYNFSDRTKDSWSLTIDGYTPGLITTIYRANVNEMTKPTE